MTRYWGIWNPKAKGFLKKLNGQFILYKRPDEAEGYIKKYCGSSPYLKPKEWKPLETNR